MALKYRASQKDLSEAPVRPTLEKQGGRRLSKPRMKTLSSSPSSSALETSASSPKHSPLTHRSHSTLDLLSPGTTLSPSDLRHQQQLHSASVEDVRRNNSMEDTNGKKPSTVKDRISRTGTIISKRTSVRLSLGGLKSQSRLSLPAPSEVSTEEKDRMIDEIRQKAHNDNAIALQYSSPVESEEVGAPKAPIRRRSLFTPGLATRNASDVLKRQPEPVQPAIEDDREDFDYYYNPKLSDSSPLGRIAALDLANGRRPFTPTSRCSTPGDMDRGLIGSGCGLRITNGAASPGPSILSMATDTRKSSGDPYQESYYTASEGGMLDEDMLQPQVRSINRRSFEYVDGHTTPKANYFHGRVFTSLKGPREQSRPSSPHRTESQQTGVSESYFNQQPVSSPVDGAPVFAQQYIEDIRTSPYASTADLGYCNDDQQPNQSIDFESTTKANEFEAHLFDDPASRPSSRDQVQNWSTTYTTENGQVVEMESTTTNTQQTSFTYTTSTTVHSVSGPSSAPLQQRPGPVMVKSDSGYSSSTSLKSLGKQRASPLFSLPSDSSVTSISREDSFDKGQRDALDVKPAPRNSFGIDTPYVTDLDGTEYVPRPMTRMQSRLYEPAPPSRGRSPEAKTAYRLSFDGVKLPPPEFSATSGLAPIPGSPTAPTPEEQTVPEVETKKSLRARSSSRAGKKLQKKPRPKSMPPPADRIMIAGNRDVSGNHVPEIPTALFARHALRLQEFPPLERTVLDFGTQGEPEYNDEPAPVSAPVRFPSPSHSPVASEFFPVTKKGVFSGRKLSLSKRSSQHFPPDEKQKRPSLEPTKSWRRRSRQSSPELADVSTISDFGDMSALGQSPYDLAASTLTNASNVRSKRGSLIHPHQLTSTMVRPKSMYNLSDREAAELSQLRSYYKSLEDRPLPAPPSRAPPPPPAREAPPPPPPASSTPIESEQQDGRTHQQSRPPQPRRSSRDFPPSSRHSFDDRGGVPGKMPRTKSMLVDTPPVPAIPVRAQVDDMERQAKASHRRSMQAPSKNERWESFSAAWAQRRKSAGEGLQTQAAQTQGRSSHEDGKSRTERWAEKRAEKKARPSSMQVSRTESAPVITAPPLISRASSQYSCVQDQGPPVAIRTAYSQASRAQSSTPDSQRPQQQQDPRTSQYGQYNPYAPRNEPEQQYHEHRLAPPTPHHAPSPLSKSNSSSSLRSQRSNRDLGVNVQEGTVARLSGRFESARPQQPGHEGGAHGRPEPGRLHSGLFQHAGTSTPGATPSPSASSVSVNANPNTTSSSNSRTAQHPSQQYPAPHASRSAHSDARRSQKASGAASATAASASKPRTSNGSSKRDSVNAGRFENGFGYGFEPGRGVGGSAGTRGVGGGRASRKSVEWSKGYGVDLSDVPIMVVQGGSGR